MVTETILEKMMTELRLVSIRDRLDTLLDEASRAKMSYRELLTFLFKQELQHKDAQRVNLAMKLAKFPCIRTIEQFDFEAQPGVDPAQIRDLAQCRWINNGDTVMLLGPPGVGKTHLAIALGREAIMQGYSTSFITATTLLLRLSTAHKTGNLQQEIVQLSKPKLLIIDELGYLPFERDAAHLFFQLISHRYEKGSLLVTSNRPVHDWGTVFGDSVVATAILDRILHHSHVLAIKGESYRLREKRMSGIFKTLD